MQDPYARIANPYGPDDRGCLVRRIVIHENHFVFDSMKCGRQTFQQRFNIRPFLEGRDDDSEF
jgi:hypothetical protein